MIVCPLPRRSPSRRFAPLVLVAALALVGACDEAVDPFADTDRYYTVFGYLDPGADSQFVRVEPLRRRIEPPPPAPLAATVTVTEQETGVVYVLRDSLITFAEGRVGHVFVGTFTPQHGRTYTLRVERDADGAAATATTFVPGFFPARVEEPRSFTNTDGTVRTTQQVVWPALGYTPHRVEVWYRFGPRQPGEPFQDAAVVYTGRDLGRETEEGWIVTARLSEDQAQVRDTLGVDPAIGFPYPLYNVGMRVTEPDSLWRPPGGVWDRDVLSQPGVFSNVEGGFGFFGSVGQQTVEWTLSPELTRRIGYRYPD